MLAATAKSIVGPAHTGKGSTGSKISLGIGFTVIWKAASALVQPVTALRPHTRIGTGPMGVPGAAAALNEEIPVETKLSAWGSALFESGSPAVAPPVHLNKEGELAPARFCGSVDRTPPPHQTIKTPRSRANYQIGRRYHRRERVHRYRDVYPISRTPGQPWRNHIGNRLSRSIGRHAQSVGNGPASSRCGFRISRHIGAVGSIHCPIILSFCKRRRAAQVDANRRAVAYGDARRGIKRGGGLQRYLDGLRFVA